MSIFDGIFGFLTDSLHFTFRLSSTTEAAFVKGLAIFYDLDRDVRVQGDSRCGMVSKILQNPIPVKLVEVAMNCAIFHENKILGIDF